MNIFLNLILIAIVCGFTNSAPTTSKTIPSTNTIFSVSTSNSENSTANLPQNNYYLTTFTKNIITTTLKVPVTQRINFNNCNGTKTVSTQVYDLCLTIDNTVKTPCIQTTLRSWVTSLSCFFSTEYLTNPIPVTTTQCQDNKTVCRTKKLYKTSSSIIQVTTTPRSYKTIPSSYKTIPTGVNRNHSSFKTVEVIYPTVTSYCVNVSENYECIIPKTDIETDIETITETDIETLPPKTTTTTTTKTVDKSTSSTTTTTTPAKTYCPPKTITVTEKETITDVEEETVTVTIKIPKPTDKVDDSKCGGRFAQCGGKGYSGPTCCKNGLKCYELNNYFSQCI